MDLGGTGITAYGWIRSDDPGRIAGGETVFVGGLDGVRDLRGFVAFDLSGFGPADMITSATVSLWSQGATTFNANGDLVIDKFTYALTCLGKKK